MLATANKGFQYIILQKKKKVSGQYISLTSEHLNRLKSYCSKLLELF